MLLEEGLGEVAVDGDRETGIWRVVAAEVTEFRLGGQMAGGNREIDTHG